MPSPVSLGCLLFLCLVTRSFSLCVIKNLTSSTCTESSLVVVSQSQLETDNGFNLTIMELPSVSTNCSITNEENHVKDVMMGNISLDYEFIDINKTMMKVQVPGNTSGEEIISFSFQLSDPNCYDVLVTMNHEITLKAIGNPEIHKPLGSSHSLYCIIDNKTPNCYWIVFKMNDEEIGYCCRYTTSPVEYKNDLSIHYDAKLERCILDIEKITSKNEGNYSCSVIIPQDDGDDLIMSSNTKEIRRSNNYEVEIGISAGTCVTISIIIACIIIFASWKRGYLCFRRRHYEEIRNNGQHNDGQHNNDRELNNSRIVDDGAST